MRGCKDLVEKDPIMTLGYGITAYRNIMWSLVGMFCILTLLCLPALIIFKTGDGYSHKSNIAMGGEVWSLGNLGYSSMECTKIPLGVGKISISCPYGTIG